MLISLKKQIIWSLILFVMVFFSANVVFNLGSTFVSKTFVSKTAMVLSSENQINSEIITEPNIKLAFVGDIMLDRGVRYMVNKNFAGDYSQLFSNVKKQLQSYDLLFGNLEGPVSDKGSDFGSLYSFRMDPQVIPVLKDTGFDIFSVTNNHSFNWGRLAFEDTLARLSDAGIIYVGGGMTGSEAYQEKIMVIKGVKVAFLAFSEFKDGGVSSNSTNSGIATISEKAIQEGVYNAKMKADLVVVSYHFGEEYQTMPNQFQRDYAKLAIDSGADLVIGHHPHVVETLEQYKNAYIIYSLGNFVFDQYFSLETMWGGLLEVEANPNTKLIEKVTLKKVSLNKMYQIESIE